MKATMDQLPINHNKIIRVFPRKTKWSPTDDLAFFDDPPLFDLPDLPVMVSVTFTWDIRRGRELSRSWTRRSNDVRIGGPAFDDPGREFTPGMFIKKGVTFTSRGCPKKCSWCLVPRREGPLRELKITPGNIVNDNNILACSRPHFEAVCEMLKGQKNIQFKGGLDIGYLTPWHVEHFKKMRLDELWVACDNEAALKKLDNAADLLSDFSIAKKRCYVMVGFDGETRKQARRRCEAVLAKGFLPFAQLYRGIDSGPLRGDWRNFCFYWSSPRYYRKEN